MRLLNVLALFALLFFMDLSVSNTVTDNDAQMRKQQILLTIEGDPVPLPLPEFINFSIENVSEFDTYYWGDGYDIEKFVEGEWNLLKPDPAVAIARSNLADTEDGENMYILKNLILYSMKPGAKTDMVLDVGIYNGQIDDGLYRLVIDTPSPTTIEAAQGKEAYIINEQPIVFEFTVSDDGLTKKTSF